MKTAIRDDNPVIIFEDKMMYRSKGRCRPRNTRSLRHGGRQARRPDITIVATSSMVQVALAAAVMLEERDQRRGDHPRTTFPLDKQALIDSAKKTWRVIVVDEGYSATASPPRSPR